MEGVFGKKVWVFTDGLRPPEGAYSEKGHESLMIVNTTDEVANVELTVYFEEKEPIRGKVLSIGAKRVRCFRTSNSEDMDGFVPECYEKYAMVLESNVDIVAQYGVLDASNQPMHLYSLMGYPCEN